MNSYRVENTLFAIACFICVVLVIGGCGACAYTQLNEHDVTLTVKSKERVAENDDGKYLIFTTENKTYQNTDNIFFGKTDSSDMYSAFEVGATYDCTAVGVRFGLLSMYENLIDCEEVASP